MLDSITDLAGEGSAIGKAAAIASTTISTYQSAQAAYASVVGIPIAGPVLAPIAAGVAVAGGLANIKKILSTKTPGNKPTGGTPPLPTATNVTPYDPSAALGAAANADTGVGGNTITTEQTGSSSQVVKAYVVSDDMTSQQEADKKINDLARL